MSNQDLTINAYKPVATSNKKSQSPDKANAYTQRACLNNAGNSSPKNKYFEPTRNYKDILEYSTKAVKDFMQKINEKIDNCELDEQVDKFFEDITSKNNTEFKILRNEEGEICGGFTTHINKKNNSLHVSSFFLDDSSKKKSVIKEMFEEIKKRAENHQCESITGDVTGNNQLKRSERMGFVENKKTFLQTLLEWNVLDRYILKNKEVSCPVEKFAKNWVY